jgi:hypothetical protein
MTIAPGDLVMMVHRLCDCPDCCRPLGVPFVVQHIAGASNEPVHCATDWRRDIGYAPVARGLGTYNIPVSALVKIDPPAIDEDVTTEREVTA